MAKQHKSDDRLSDFRRPDGNSEDAPDAVALLPGNVGVFGGAPELEIVNTANSRWRRLQLWDCNSLSLEVGCMLARWVGNSSEVTYSGAWGYMPERVATYPFPHRENSCQEQIAVLSAELAELVQTTNLWTTAEQARNSCGRKAPYPCVAALLNCRSEVKITEIADAVCIGLA